MQEAVIVDCVRTAVGKAPRGTLRNSRPDDLAATVIGALLDRYPQAKPEVEDVIVGCAMPEGEAGSNLARQAAPRADTSIEALGKLRPVFHASGTVTAGNSSQTSDGAAAALIMSQRRARALGLRPKARFVSFATAGVPPEIMGIGPVVAIPKALAI